MSDPRRWHRHLGMLLRDTLHDLAVTVHVEKDLSVKQQFLDTAIVRLGDLPADRRLPDGFGELARHNLITFKSFHDALGGFALCELVGHYVNYRKQAGPSFDDMPPEADFRLIAISARRPQSLEAAGRVELAGAGVYDLHALGLVIRVIVVNELPHEPHNSLLLMFSPRDADRRYGAEHYQVRSRDGSTVLSQLFQGLRKEGFDMPYTVEDMRREALEMFVKEGMLAAVPAEQRLEGIPVEKRLEGVPVDEILKSLPPEALEALKKQLRPEPPKDPAP